MFETIKNDFYEKEIGIQEISISKLIDDFCMELENREMSLSEQLDSLDFINQLFKFKHRYILECNKPRRTYNRDTQLFHLEKIQRFAKGKIKQVKKVSPRKKYEPSDRALEFKKIINELSKKMKQEISDKTKRLLEELMKERWTVKEKTSLLRNILKREKFVFDDILESNEKEEVITSLLALTDMAKKEEVLVIQDRNFGEIIIKKNSVTKTAV